MVRPLTMVSAVVCCGGWMVVAGWLGALLGGGAAVPAPPPASTDMPAVLWHVAGEGRGTPAVIDDRAFFLSKHHELIAIDIASGATSWRRGTGGPGETTAGAAVVAAGRLAVAGDGGLVAFTYNGRERWRFRPTDDGFVGVYLGEAGDGRIFTGSVTGRVWAVDAATGVPAWSARVSRDDTATVFAPIVSDRVVLAGFTSFGAEPVGGLASVDLASGRVRWSTTLPAGRPGTGRAFAGGPVVAGGRVIVASHDGAVHGFHLVSGHLAWSIPPPLPPPFTGAFEFRSMVRAGGVLVAASLTGAVTAYDLATRQERWRRQPVDGSVIFGLATDGRTVYVPYLSGQLVALAVDDGAERWRTRESPAAFSWRPLVAAGRVLAVSSSAGFFAFRP